MKDIKLNGLTNTELINEEREELYQRILNFKATTLSSFGDALEWQIEERKDRDLPFRNLNDDENSNLRSS